MGAQDVTICTVLTPLHWRLMALNRTLIESLNPGAAPHWLIVDNKGVHEGANPGAIGDYFPAAEIVEGVTPEAAAAHFGAGKPKSPGSYHHAAGLNQAMARVATRYALILDPDFYVVRRDWIAETLAHMRAQDLALFGAPWNPRWHQKPRDFPCAHFLLIDLEKLPWRMDLFAPDVVTAGPKFASSFWRDVAARERIGGAGFWGALLRAPHRAVWHDIKQRREIGASPDTGHRLRAEIAARPGAKVGLLQPVFAPEVEGFEPPVVTRPQYAGLAQALAPDTRAYVPKRSGYAAREGFREHGLPDTRALRWEEFLWRDAPFAFHVRGELHRAAQGVDVSEVASTLNEIAARLDAPPVSGVSVAKPSLDIVVCTYNRARALDAALASIPAEAAARLDLGVLVVDNNSKDDTQAAAARHLGRLPLRIVKEERQGLSFARNRGVRETQREFLLFLDDDAVFCEGYFDALAAALRRFNPDFFGGPVFPAFEQPPPAWFDPAIETRCYETRSGLTLRAGISGGNYGVRRALLLNLGGFANELGMIGARMGFGEDRELLERYRARTPHADQRVYYGLDLAVHHEVAASKVSLDYQTRRQFSMARSREMVFTAAGVRSPVRARLLALGRIVLAPLGAAWRILRAGLSSRGWFSAAMHLSAVAGRAAGAFARMPSAAPPPRGAEKGAVQ